MAEHEVPLTGGRLTPGVVRVGATVRRPAPEFTATVLRHLAAAGFAQAPRCLGWDERGRVILSYLDGEVPARWRHFEDVQVAAAASMLRGLHDASRGLAARLGGGDVVCHHDPGPNNTVFRDGMPVAFIDFDMAAPGDPLEDLAYLAWSWCLSSKPERGPVAAQARQVRVLVDAYGLEPGRRHDVPDALAERLAANVRFWEEHSAEPRAYEMITWTRREAGYLAAYRETLLDALNQH